MFWNNKNKPPRLFSLDFSENVLSKTKRLKAAPVIRLFFGTNCILKCRYCFTDAPHISDNQRNIIVDEKKLSRKIVNIAKRLETQTVLINGKGEPLLEKDKLFDLIRNNHENGLKTTLFTSGILLEEKDLDFLWTHGVDLVLKLPSLNANTTTKVTGCNVQKKLLKAINMCVQFGYTRDHRLGIDNPLTAWNEKDVLDIFNFCRKLDIVPFVEPVVEFGRAQSRDVPSAEQVKTIVHTMKKIDKEKYGYRWSFFDKSPLTAMSPILNNNFLQIGANRSTLHFIHGKKDTIIERSFLGELYATTRYYGESDSALSKMIHNYNKIYSDYRAKELVESSSVLRGLFDLNHSNMLLILGATSLFSLDGEQSQNQEIVMPYKEPFTTVAVKLSVQKTTNSSLKQLFFEREKISQRTA